MDKRVNILCGYFLSHRWSLSHILLFFTAPQTMWKASFAWRLCENQQWGLDLTHGSGPCTRQSFEGRICVLVVWVFSEHTVSAPLMPVWLVSAGLTQLHWGLEWGYEFQTHFIHLLLLLLSRSVTSNSLWPHGLQHSRFPCPSPSSRACSKPYPSIWWCYLTISSSATLFSFCLQSFPASGSFAVSQLFVSGGQSIGPSALAAGLPMNIQS